MSWQRATSICLKQAICRFNYQVVHPRIGVRESDLQCAAFARRRAIPQRFKIAVFVGHQLMRTNTVKNRRSMPVLRLLTSVPGLRSLPETVEIAGLGTFSTPDFFVPFDSVMPGHQNMTLGFFGKITNAKLDPNERAL
jgi:hypothetical protein